MPDISWAEPNELCWIKYMKSLASESIFLPNVGGNFDFGVTLE